MKRSKFFRKNEWLMFLGLTSMIIITTAATLVKRHQWKQAIPREEIRTYIEINVKPVLVAYREKLDTELSADEKQQIASIKTELKTLRDSQKELGKTLREKHKNGEEPTSEEKSELRSIMRQVRQITQGAWDIADAHSDFYDNMLVETESDRKKWRDEIHEIIKASIAERKENKPETEEEVEKERPERKGPRGDRHHRGNKGGRLGGFGIMGRLDPENPHAEVAFLLWNPNEPFFPEKDNEFMKDETMIYPNPAFDGSNLTYKVNTKGTVQIELFNAKGESIKTIQSEVKEAGKYTIDTDITDLQNGMYYYKISTPDGTVTKKFIKK